MMATMRMKNRIKSTSEKTSGGWVKDGVEKSSYMMQYPTSAWEERVLS